MRRSRYRIRSWLRWWLSEPLARFFPAGPHDCGRHEWYHAELGTDRCVHCLVGVRDHVPHPLVLDSPEWRMITEGVERGSPVMRDVLTRRLAEHRDASARAAREAERALAGSRRSTAGV